MRGPDDLLAFPRELGIETRTVLTTAESRAVRGDLPGAAGENLLRFLAAVGHPPHLVD